MYTIIIFFPLSPVATTNTPDTPQQPQAAANINALQVWSLKKETMSPLVVIGEYSH